jgi:hypothetical protein
MKKDSYMQTVGGVVGAAIGSKFGWIGAGIGAFVGIVASELIQEPKQQSARMNSSRSHGKPSGQSSARQTTTARKMPADGGKYNICAKCNTANEETLLLCEFCGERMPVKDVDFDIGVLTLRHAKGNKQRLVPMHNSLTNILRKYCMAMGMIGYPEAYLFPTSDPTEPVSTHNAQHRFNFILERANISLPGRRKHQRGPCLHCLRHVFAFQSFANSEREGRRIDDTVPYLSTYLGHESLRETEKYLKFSNEMFPDAMELFDDYTAQVFPEVNFNE